MKYIQWPRGPVLLLTFAIILFLIPAEWEGPDLIHAERGFGLSVINFLALVPLLASVTWIQNGLWKRRIYLFNKITMYPGAASLLIFFMGLGLGLLTASAFRSFSYWWAVGGLIFIAMLINVVLISGKTNHANK